ncbi:MAG: helix-turn-helix transcriptional regulator [Alphaproteobacteria bacterium]|nr:helix-turn-helix transcriptional regulator [Alphaproteobacteria bacterium]
MSGKTRNIINARQIKAARALLDWSQEHLAEACNLSIATIRKVESGHISPRNSTMGGIQHSFENAGLEFLESNGVRQRPEDISVFNGEESVVAFFDDVYHTVSKVGGDVIVVCPNANTVYTDILKEYRHIHIKRMAAISDKVCVKCILTESKTSLPAQSYCEYRYLPSQMMDVSPFYVYGNKISFRLFSGSRLSKIIVIESYELARTFRKQFESMWGRALPISLPSLVISKKNTDQFEILEETRKIETP